MTGLRVLPPGVLARRPQTPPTLNLALNAVDLWPMERPILAMDALLGTCRAGEAPTGPGHVAAAPLVRDPIPGLSLVLNAVDQHAAAEIFVRPAIPGLSLILNAVDQHAAATPYQRPAVTGLSLAMDALSGTVSAAPYTRPPVTGLSLILNCLDGHCAAAI